MVYHASNKRRCDGLPMKIISVLVAAMTVTACARSAKPPAASSPDMLTACNGAAVQHLVGRERTRQTEAEAMRRSGASELRWLAPGEPASMDYRTDRLNLETDGNRIVRIYCG